MVKDRRPNTVIPQFSLKQLLLAMALVMASMGMMLGAIRVEPFAELSALLWLTGGALFGAGVGILFGRPYAGALLGFQLQIVTMLILVSVLDPT